MEFILGIHCFGENVEMSKMFGISGDVLDNDVYLCYNEPCYIGIASRLAGSMECLIYE